jgi:multidrug efflux pump subunit AcrB
MNISKIALENSRVTILVVIMVIVMGVAGYLNLSRDAMPPFTIRTANVVTPFPGASAQRVEELVTERIERVAQELAEVKKIASESRTGVSIVTVELVASVTKKEMQPIWDKLRRKLEEIQPDMPDGVGTIMVKDDELGVTFGIQLGLLGEGYTMKELEDKAEDVRDELVKLPDAAKVEISGIQAERIFVAFDNARLARYGLSVMQLQQTIAATNIVFPGGSVVMGDQRLQLEPTGNYESIEDLAETVIRFNQTETAKLGEIAEISRGYVTPMERIVRIDGQQGLALAISIKDNANLVALGEDVDVKMRALNQSLPVGMQLQRISSQDTYVQASVNDFVSNVLQSVGIVMVVMFLFLGWRTGLTVASLIPLAIISALLLMSVFDIGLNKVTLAALIMALGMLVDNAIVITESMMVNMEKGMPPKAAAYAATSELAIPLLISSLTTSAAFFAFFLAEDVMGEMMGNLFLVITFSLLSSWVLALTVVVMIGIALIRVEVNAGADAGAQNVEAQGKGDLFTRLGFYYGKLIYKALKWPFLTLAVIVAMFFGSLMLFPSLPFTFFPDSDRNLITIDVNLPEGTDINRTAAVVTEIENWIMDKLRVTAEEAAAGAIGITDFTSFTGQGPKSYDLGYLAKQPNPNNAHLLLNTSSFEANNEMIRRLQAYTFAGFPDAEITVSSLSAGGAGDGNDVSVRVSGPDMEELYRISQSIKRLAIGMPGATNISDNWGPLNKKVVIDIDQDKANRAGITNQDVALSLMTSLSGYTAGSYREGEDALPIKMGSLVAQDYDVEGLRGLNVFAQGSGQNVALTQVAEVNLDWQYAKIMRRDLNRTLTVGIDAREGYTPSNLTSALVPELEALSKNWPPGYFYELGGEEEQSADAMGAVAAELPLAGFIIVLLLMLQFNSFRKSTIVLLTIPLGLIGVIIGLFLFNSYFGFMAFMGIISLAGILINNAIVLIDRIEIEEKAGKTEFLAIVDACKQRFRPILLTTFTTTFGLVPLYLGGGLMWEPMAIAIMIGLLFATVITLLFVPVTYKLLFRIKEKTPVTA